MKHRYSFALLLAPLALLLAHCGANPGLTPLPPEGPASSAPPAHSSAPPLASETPDAPFRQQAPTAGPEAPWQAPVPLEQKLSNGIRVLMVPMNKLPIVVLQVVSRHGADQQAAPGQGSFLGEMLSRGTKARSAIQISDEHTSIGADLRTWVDWDSSNIYIKVLPQHLEKGLSLISDLAQNPTFPTEEIERVRAQRLASLQQQADIPQAVMANTIVRSLYPKHVYGESLLGTPASVKQIGAAQLSGLYRKLFTLRDTFIVATGDINPETLIPQLEKAFGAWRPAAGNPAPVRRPAAPSREIVLVDMPGAAQSQIALAGVGVERLAKDYDSVLMTNTIFGGMFSSRLNLNLREQHAFTYGARSNFQMRHGPGPFVAQAAVDTPKTGPALQEMLSEVERICQSPVRPEEMNLALGYLVKSLPGQFQSSSETAGSIAWLGIHGLPLDEFRSRPARLAALTPEQVVKASQEHLNPNQMKIVVVGDRSKIEAQLKELHFGPIVLLDAQGKSLGTVAASGESRSFSCKSAQSTEAPPVRRPNPGPPGPRVPRQPRPPRH